MDDARIWEFETKFWTGGEEVYRESVDENCLMVVPADPFILTGEQATEAIRTAPRWSQVELSEGRIARPQDGLIVVAYKAKASRGEQDYAAWCSSTYRRLAHDAWRLVQHQQTIDPGADG